ncbi:serine/threonine-protein kinase [Nocardia sp. IFM 10818]
MLETGEVFAGYTIERRLGRGGMGSVYLAQHPRLPRKTALKLLNPDMFGDAEVRARFEREADLVARLDHPNVVAVYDRGVEGDRPWISMQYVDGVDAATVDPLTLHPKRAMQIVTATAAALDYASGAGVLHRDVKPANILLARSKGGEERVFLTDFGIARLREDSAQLTRTGTFTATLEFASPEQLTGQPLDGRSDQYALACTLFWLLTGRTPYSSPQPTEVIRGHLQETPPSVRRWRPEVPSALDTVLHRALAKRPAERYGSCTEFARAAKRALTAATGNDSPTTSVPDAAVDARAGYGASRQSPSGHAGSPPPPRPGPFPPAGPLPGHRVPPGSPRPSGTGVIVGLCIGLMIAILLAVGVFLVLADDSAAGPAVGSMAVVSEMRTGPRGSTPLRG